MRQAKRDPLSTAEGGGEKCEGHPAFSVGVSREVFMWAVVFHCEREREKKKKGVVVGVCRERPKRKHSNFTFCWSVVVVRLRFFFPTVAGKQRKNS